MPVPRLLINAAIFGVTIGVDAFSIPLPIHKGKFNRKPSSATQTGIHFPSNDVTTSLKTC